MAVLSPEDRLLALSAHVVKHSFDRLMRLVDVAECWRLGGFRSAGKANGSCTMTTKRNGDDGKGCHEAPALGERGQQLTRRVACGEHGREVRRIDPGRNPR